MIITQKENIWVWFTKGPTIYSGTTIPQRNQPAMCWQLDYTGLFPSWKGRCIVLTGTETWLEYGFSFIAHICSAKKHHLYMLYQHSITSDQGTHLTVNEVWIRKKLLKTRWVTISYWARVVSSKM